MKPRYTILYLLLAGLTLLSTVGCYKELDCSESSANLPEPIPQTKFRIIDTVGRDLLASSTPGSLNFDSLVARQPCNANIALGKKIVQTGSGVNESYVFSFGELYQPVTGENAECFTLILNWSDGDVDTIEFQSSAEHHSCGVTYYLDGVTYNGKSVQKDAQGNFLLRR